MKNKRILIVLLVLMLGSTYSVHAQSSIDQKHKQDMERIKKRREELMMKAREQRSQANEERRPQRINSNSQIENIPAASDQQNAQMVQQPNGVLSKHNKRPVLNRVRKKEDTNQ